MGEEGFSMIDRRNISYTQGTPLSPVVNGTLLQTKPSVDVPKGTVVSTKRDVRDPVTGRTTIGKTEKQIQQEQIKPIDPFSLVGYGAPGGISFQGALSFWDLLFGSAESQQKTALGMVAGSTGYIEKLGLYAPGSTKQITDIPVVDFPGSDIPGLPALDTALPGSGDLIGGATNIFTGGNGFKLPSIGNALLIGAGIIGALYLGGKYLQGRGKK